MKIQKNVFKNIGKVVLVLSVLLITSCGSDDDGDDVIADAFVTLPSEVLDTYEGTLSYTPANGMGVVAETDGTATISRTGDTYTINFSDGVPSITGLRFIESSTGAYASVGANGSALGIDIGVDDLAVGATIGGNVWAFSSN